MSVRLTKNARAKSVALGKQTQQSGAVHKKRAKFFECAKFFETKNMLANCAKTVRRACMQELWTTAKRIGKGNRSKSFRFAKRKKASQRQKVFAVIFTLRVS